MNQSLPQKVRVFGVDVPISLIEQPYLDAVEVDGLFQDSRILVKVCLSPRLVQEILLHEVVHAIDDAMQIKLSEKQVTQIARGLLGVFCDSPEFKKFLLEVDA